MKQMIAATFVCQNCEKNFLISLRRDEVLNETSIEDLTTSHSTKLMLLTSLCPFCDPYYKQTRLVETEVHGETLLTPAPQETYNNIDISPSLS
jgi:hypothetical protein